MGLIILLVELRLSVPGAILTHTGIAAWADLCFIPPLATLLSHAVC